MWLNTDYFGCVSTYTNFQSLFDVLINQEVIYESIFIYIKSKKDNPKNFRLYELKRKVNYLKQKYDWSNKGTIENNNKSQ